ncbi:MAG: GNAT family N-acetyltransferase, partial [bacterium]|nr:GNAT family N-acetyltransferase [bacterium]
LATAAGAALTLYCLEHNITPHWNAANQNSANLAQKLGYTQNDHYHPFRLLP